MRVFGLIGYPLTHSFSGAYFEKKFQESGLSNHRYHLYPMPQLDGFTDWVHSIEGLVGLNVTIPHKKNILPFLDEHRLPAGSQACNCIHISEGKLIGYNTDVIGFAESLKPYVRPQHDRALVLGQGGAAEAVCHVLQQWQIPYRTVSRTKRDSDQLVYQELTKALIEEYRLIIQTTPLGTYPRVEEFPSIPYEGIGADHLLYDLVYNPPQTIFLQRGAERGATTINGLRMLEIQAEASWSIWNGGLTTY